MKKIRYIGKAMALFYALRNFRLTPSNLDDANSKSANLQERARDARLLVRMARDTISGEYKMGVWNMSVIVGTLAYVITPIDAIPDILPGIGWLDDITIVTYALTRLRRETNSYLAFKSERAKKTGAVNDLPEPSSEPIPEEKILASQLKGL